jgi:Protein of unknown function (DUF1573)
MIPETNSSKQTSGWWLIAVAAGLLPALVLDPIWLFDRAIPVSISTLEVPESIDVGQLQPSERRAIRVVVRNAGWRNVPLRSVESDCGCLVVRNTPQVLRIGESATIAGTLMSPSEPGVVSRTLLFRPRGIDGVAWQVRVHGHVEADVWAIPPRVDCQLGPDHTAESLLKVFHLPNVAVDHFTSSSTAIQIADTQVDESSTELRIKVLPDSHSNVESGWGTIEAYGRTDPDRPLATIPVRWRLPPKIGYVPPRLELPQYGIESDNHQPLRRALAIVLPADQPSEQARIVALVPWVRVIERDVRGSALRVELEFDQTQMPEEFSQAIISTDIGEEHVEEKLLAAGYRS